MYKIAKVEYAKIMVNFKIGTMEQPSKIEKQEFII